ncbi:unnamed protein product [Xylocopa violacea]|uniref:DNA repair protein RAD52-like protein n=1 Tax=Xylocopa violacea TaxID=135666 RepID=A0ABP1PC64_XYLVO
MNNATNYPSCIKIPSTNSKQNMQSTMLPQKFDIKDSQIIYNELISLANRIFGERKWSHSITNQTIDFVEAFMGKYVCGCATFVKIQLHDGMFHEDMGYCHAEGAMKGLSIHSARIGSHTDAFKRVLSCFGNEVQTEIQKLSRNILNTHVVNNEKEDLNHSLFSLPSEMLEPCAQSTPLLTLRNNENKEKTDKLVRPKSPNDQKGQTRVEQTVIAKKSPAVAKVQSMSVKTLNDVKNYEQNNGTNHQTEEDNVQKEQDSKRVLSEEELLRLERKRKQMEKQAEYKRLMKEREQQKFNENRKPHPKY